MGTVTHITLHGTQGHCHPHNFTQYLCRTVTHITLHSTYGHCHPHNFTQYIWTLSPTQLYTVHMDTVTHITLHNTHGYCHPHNFTHGHCHPQLNYSSLFERIQCSGTRERYVQQSRNMKANRVSPVIHGEPF